MRPNIVWGVIAGVALLAVGWLLGRQTAPSPAPPADGVKVVATRPADAPAPQTIPGTVPHAVPTLAATATGAPARIPDDESLRQTLPDPAMSANALYRRLRAEPIDAAAAARMQRVIDAGLVKVPYLDRDKLRVRCATTLCEIHGDFVAGASTDNVNVAMQGLQGGALREGLKAAGLEIALGSFGSDGFTIYTQPHS